MFHGENKLLDQLAGMLADDGCAKNFVAAALYKDTRKAAVCSLDDGAIAVAALARFADARTARTAGNEES